MKNSYSDYFNLLQQTQGNINQCIVDCIFPTKLFESFEEILHYKEEYSSDFRQKILSIVELVEREQVKMLHKKFLKQSKK